MEQYFRVHSIEPSSNKDYVWVIGSVYVSGSRESLTTVRIQVRFFKNLAIFHSLLALGLPNILGAENISKITRLHKHFQDFIEFLEEE